MTTTTVDRFFAAMQTQGQSEAEMLNLFTDDAVYVEPFTGAERSHSGREAVRAALREGWKQPLPDMRIQIDEVAVDGDVTRARWTCFSPALPGGSGRGENTFTLRGGLIARLETRFLR
ncbi:MAG: nuclear transport factor 2 family protein [Myxococcaceae bacterium]|nr:nuclear transport factor 2 family protein [Myxococcaceae bacterium]